EARTKFFDRLFMEVPGLIGTRLLAQFLAKALHRDLDLVDRHLDLWRNAASRTARQTYGEIVGLVALTQPEVDWGRSRLEGLLADEAGAPERTGVALSAANLFVSGADRTKPA